MYFVELQKLLYNIIMSAFLLYSVFPALPYIESSIAVNRQLRFPLWS